MKNTTPNALPSSMITLGDFGASMSLDCARRVQYVDWNRIKNPAKKRSECWVDIWTLKPDGDTHIIRSARTDLTVKQAIRMQRDVTRRIAVFLFENKNVGLKSPLKLVKAA